MEIDTIVGLQERMNTFFNILLDLVPIRLPECEWCGDPMLLRTTFCEECAWDLRCGGLDQEKER